VTNGLPAGPERRAAGLAFAIAAVILLATIPVVRPVAESLRSNGYLRATTLAAGGFVSVAAAIAVFRAARARRLRRPLVLVVAATLYAIAFFSAALPEERIHLVEYAVLGLLALRVVRPGLPGVLDRVIAATLLAFLVGWIDEAIQGLLPSRVYDPRDVGLNFLGAALAIAAQEFSMPVDSFSSGSGSGEGAPRRRAGDPT
jgi:hypothetical protein